MATAAAPEAVFVWTPAASGTATIETCGAGTAFDTVVYLRDTTCAGAELACNDDTLSCATGDICGNRGHHGSLVTPTVFAGHTYVIVVDGYAGSCGGSSGAFALTVIPPVSSTTTTSSTSSTTTVSSTSSSSTSTTSSTTEESTTSSSETTTSSSETTTSQESTTSSSESSTSTTASTTSTVPTN